MHILFICARVFSKSQFYIDIYIYKENYVYMYTYIYIHTEQYQIICQIIPIWNNVEYVPEITKPNRPVMQKYPSTVHGNVPDRRLLTLGVPNYLERSLTGKSSCFTRQNPATCSFNPGLKNLAFTIGGVPFQQHMTSLEEQRT